MKSVLVVSSGNFLEMYDFTVYGYYAAWIAKAFFPTANPYASLMLSFAVFGAGALMRPIGAIVLGAYIDRRGRRRGLLLTLALMALGTVSIATMPTYAKIGLVAPLLVLSGRLIQGLSAGAELGGVSVYLSEIATPGNKGFYVSWQSGSQQVAVVFAALLGIMLTEFLSTGEMSRWGWRVPFLAGCLLIPLLLAMRSSLKETPSFANRTYRPSTWEVFRLIGANWKIVALGTLLVTMTTVSFYLITAYTPTYGSQVLHLAARDSMIVTLCVGVSNFVLLPIMGSVSDKIGRRPLLLGCTIGAILTGYPVLMWLVSEPSFGRLLTVELWLSVIYATYNAAMIVFLTEIMPEHVRTSGFSVAYSIATALFGGFTPAVCTYLIHATGNRAMPGVWLSAAAACGLTATVLLSPKRVTEALNLGRENHVALSGGATTTQCV
jgi:metabolite-proton symporter